MTITDTGPATAPAVLDAVRALAPAVAARAAEVEAARRVPRDLLDDLKRAGCFRLLMPPSHGGVGADLASAMGVYGELARGDASVAWTVMIGGGAWCDLGGLPRATFDAIFDRPDVIVAGAFAPSGAVDATDGGYRVNGRWSFASGCEHADVLYGNCVHGVVDGGPQLRIATFAPQDVMIEDTWTASGLRGTGSHHFHVTDLDVPADRTLDVFGDPPCLDAPILRIPGPTQFSMQIAALALGIARGALDDVLALAAGRMPLLDHAPLATNPTFHRDLAASDTGVRAAEALLHETAGWLWAIAVDGTPLSPAQRARVRAASTWSVERAIAAVEATYRSAGSSAVYADAPLQRRLRDIHTLAQHFLVKPDSLRTAGALLAGQDLDVPVF